MIHTYKNILVIIILLIIFSSCNKSETETFELDRSIISLIKKNGNCLGLLNDGFGVSEATLEEVSYLETLLGKVIDENKGVKYQRLIFLKIYEEGEVVNTSKITFGILKNGEGLLNKYYSENNHSKIQSKEMKNIDLDLLYEKIGEAQNKIVGGRTKILIIDLKSIENFECKLYDDLGANNIKKIKELIIFDK